MERGEPELRLRRLARRAAPDLDRRLHRRGPRASDVLLLRRRSLVARRHGGRTAEMEPGEPERRLRQPARREAPDLDRRLHRRGPRASDVLLLRRRSLVARRHGSRTAEMEPGEPERRLRQLARRAAPDLDRRLHRRAPRASDVLLLRRRSLVARRYGGGTAEMEPGEPERRLRQLARRAAPDLDRRLHRRGPRASDVLLLRRRSLVARRHGSRTAEMEPGEPERRLRQPARREAPDLDRRLHRRGPRASDVLLLRRRSLVARRHGRRDS